MTSEIIWTGSPDDQTAKVGNCTLRVQIKKEYWWWACYVPEGTYHGTENHKDQAKTACEKAYYEHLKTR